MKKYFFLRSIVTFSLLFSLVSGVMPSVGMAQTASATAENPYEKALAAIEEKVEARRKEHGIPGMSLVIVKDDKVIYSKGLGYKDFENKTAATADTQFAIGSSTKAFTALTVLMSADEGKFSLDDSPKKVLPYFKMQDEDTDKNMTIRDLLTHSSGLNRTDLAMITGKLNRAELIRVAGEAKPIGKLRERFGYQNLMYAAAGEVVAVAQEQPWEKFVPERIFKPLGMTNSTMSMKEMAKVKDRSLGYNYNFDTKETQLLPYRDIDEVAPAGSINSSANDMAKWLRFALGDCSFDGKRLVSEKSCEEWTKPQMKANPAGTVNYGLGWFIQKWNDHTVVQHGGNIDGFNAMVAMIPEQKLGFVMLTNVSGSPLGNELMPIVWENILGKPEGEKSGAVVPAEKEAGKYKFEAAGFDIEVKWADGKLTAHIPQQPVYTLENVGGRKYKMAEAPDGFFMTFRENELYLEQPHGNYTLPKVSGDKPAGPPSAPEAKELIGKWQTISGNTVEAKETDGIVALHIEGQQPYTLTARAKDEFNMSPLPDTFWIKIKRGDDGEITGFTSMQPQGNVEFTKAKTEKLDISVDELMAKTIEAIGGEENFSKLHSRVAEIEIDFVHQGVKGRGTTYAKAPNLSASYSVMTALGKEIATNRSFFNGTEGEDAYSFSPTTPYTGKQLENVRLSSDFYSASNWKKNYPKAELKAMGKIGDEETYIVELTPENGTKITVHYSAKTYLMLRQEGVSVSGTSTTQIPYTINYSDYREVDGIKLPFKTTNSGTGMGDVVVTLKSVKHNVEIDDKHFTRQDVSK